MLRPQTRLTMLLVLPAIALSIAGCGDSNTRAPTQSVAAANTRAKTSSGQSASEFIEHADTICGRINREIVAVRPKSASAAEVMRIVPRRVSIERKGIASLERLEPPVSIAPDWQRMLGYRRTLAVELGELVAIAKNNDGTSVKSLAASKRRVHAALAKRATASGFKDCAKIGGAG